MVLCVTMRKQGSLWGTINIPFKNTVDAFLQQLFRARDLGLEGWMDIYVDNSSSARIVAGPTDDLGLDADLQKHVDTMYSYIPRQLVTHCRFFDPGEDLPFKFHRNSLSYVCLKGCVYMQNMERIFKVLSVATELRDVRRNMKALSLVDQASLLTNPQCADVLTPDEYDTMKARLCGGETLTDVEYQRFWVYGLAVLKYKFRLHRDVDGNLNSWKEFIDTFVGPFRPQSQARSKNDLFYRMQRLHSAVRGSPADLRKTYDENMNYLMQPDQAAMTVALTKTHRFFQPVISVSQLLDRLIKEWRTLAGTGAFTFKVADSVGAMSAWLNHDIKDNDTYTNLLKLLDIPRRSSHVYTARGKMIDALSSIPNAADADASPQAVGKGDKKAKIATDHVERLVSAAFGMDFVPTKEPGHPTLSLRFKCSTKHFMITFKKLPSLFPKNSCGTTKTFLNNPQVPQEFSCFSCGLFLLCVCVCLFLWVVCVSVRHVLFGKLW
jgi:hypothetical protein